MKLFAFIILFFTHILAFSAPLTVGVIKSAPPFSEMAQSSTGPYFYGFSIDIMNSICQRIKQKCIYSPVTLDQQFTTLNQGTIDLLLIASPYNELDLNQYTTSIPYLVSNVNFVGLKTNPIDSLDDIKNLKIGVIKITFYVLLMESSYKKDNQIIPYESVADLISALIQKKVDVIVLNTGIAHNFINNNVYGIKTVGKSFPLGSGYGIIALPNHADLITQINKAIMNMQADGTYVSIYQKYYNPQM